MCSDFWRGVGVGMAAGAVVTAAVLPKPKALKTGVGRAMQRASCALDCVIRDVQRAVR